MTELISDDFDFNLLDSYHDGIVSGRNALIRFVTIYLQAAETLADKPFLGAKSNDHNRWV
jgi:hypothetical protein